MRRFVYNLLFALGAVALLTTTVVAVGRSLPTTPDLAMLHLADCSAPCWIGILPGQTTLGDAKLRLAEVYGDTTRYLIQPYRKNPSISFNVTDVTGRLAVQMRADFLIPPAAQAADDLIVQQVVLELSAANAATEDAPEHPALTIADLFAALPPPLSIEGGGITAPFIRNDRFGTQMMVGGDFGLDACTRLAIRYPVWYVVFASVKSDSNNGSRHPWRGFRACYNLRTDESAADQ